MATNVDIANLALAHIGDDADVAALDPPEGSAQAEHCARWLPIARDAMLENHPFTFAKRRAIPALTATEWGSWTHIYALPANCLKVLSVLPEGYTDDKMDSLEFDIESSDTGSLLLLTKAENVTVLYTARVTDPSRFSPLFVDALTWLLASYIAGPIYKGAEGMQMATTCYSVFRGLWGQATTSSANQSKTSHEHIPPHILARD